ncbi:MAG TPA: GNAT family N-acetyltransferase [Actinomycetota bacterium]|jgi:ribosomal protein S18 acetylase RimI-like enzyme|nr:GNAT family N-acetyltransferase [Actinomycetota bacterium]
MKDVATVEGDRVVVAEYRALREAIGWDPVPARDEDLQAALDRTWNVTARTADGRLVGLVRVLDDGAVYASIWDMMVAPELQRQGVGRALFDRVMEQVGGRNLVSLVATPAGRELYRSAGFSEESLGAVGMFRRLDPR